MKIEVAYVAHKVAGDVEANIADAKRWIQWLIHFHRGMAFCAPWITYCEVLNDSDLDHRARGMRDDIEIMKRCDLIILTGDRISEGMQAEADAMRALVRPVRDYTTPTMRGLFLAWNEHP